MNAQKLITEARAAGARFELAGDGFKVTAPAGAVTNALREALTAQKAEVVSLLSQPAYTAGNCPHCRKPIEVTTDSTAVFLRCPEGALSKRLKVATSEWCSDCGMKLAELAGRCVECVRRVMLAPDVLCPVCAGVRFWRYRASREKPAGFLWRCAECFEPSGKVAVYEIAAEEEACQQV